MNHDDTTHADLTPTDLDYTHLPEQTMYKVRTENARDADSAGVRRTPLVVRTNEFRLLYFEMEPGEAIDWHTHAPGLDEVNLCLDGRARYTLEREDGSHQTLEVGPMEFVYLPGGARHRIDAVGEAVHRSLSAARFDTVARLEDLEAGEDAENAGAADDADTGSADTGWTDALFVDRKRDEVVAKDDRYVST